MRLLLVSNGHGEDLSGARLALALQQAGAEVKAVPLVGDGGAYRQAKVPIAGRTRSFSSSIAPGPVAPVLTIRGVVIRTSRRRHAQPPALGSRAGG